MKAGNLLADVPRGLAEEQVLCLLQRPGLCIERIVSHGHVAPGGGDWFDQDRHEWVLVLQGAGRLRFEDGREIEMGPGDHLQIPAHVRHQVIWTDPAQPTVWLAVFHD